MTPIWVVHPFIITLRMATSEHLPVLLAEKLSDILWEQIEIRLPHNLINWPSYGFGKGFVSAKVYSFKVFVEDQVGSGIDDGRHKGQLASNGFFSESLVVWYKSPPVMVSSLMRILASGQDHTACLANDKAQSQTTREGGWLPAAAPCYAASFIAK